MYHNIKKLIQSFSASAYHIGFVHSKDISCASDVWYSNVRWIDSHLFDADGWFADPFFYNLNESHIFLLAEQWYYPINRGRLVKLTINRDSYLLEKVDNILTLDTHLSFPNIWRENGKEYIYPENYQSGVFRIWEFDGTRMYNPHTLIEESLLDSQIVKIGESYYVFSVVNKTGEWSDTKKLNVWKSDSLMGPYSHLQTINNNRNEERGAGQIVIINDGKILRPAQNCEGSYGKEVIIYEMIFDGDKFLEHELYRIRPDSDKKYGVVLHTYNLSEDLCVIDGLRYLHPVMHKIVKFIKGTF